MKTQLKVIASQEIEDEEIKIEDPDNPEEIICEAEVKVPKS